MVNQQIMNKAFSQLPEKAKEEVILFLEFLMNKYNIPVPKNLKETPGKRVFGISKGDYQMPEDFDDELEDFKPYMPE